MLSRLVRSRLFSAVIIGAGLFGVAAIAGVADTAVTYNGCQNIYLGTVRLLPSSLPAPYNTTCNTTTTNALLKERAISWNQVGPQGLQGIQGIQGLKGDTGGQGIQGIQGLKGDTGGQGIQGISGLKGDAGDQGIPGLKGDAGGQGIQGIQGIPGVKGDKGDQGIPGTAGTGTPVLVKNNYLVDPGDVLNGHHSDATTFCPAGKHVTGGRAEIGPGVFHVGQQQIDSNFPNDDLTGWRVLSTNGDTSQSMEVDVWVICI